MKPSKSLIFVVLAGLLMTALSAATAQAAPPTPAPSGGIGILATGAISGVVTAEDSGVPLSGIEVCAYGDNGRVKTPANQTKRF